MARPVARRGVLLRREGGRTPLQPGRPQLDIRLQDPRRARGRNPAGEADVIFRPDGELWCVSRTRRENQHSLLYTSSPPYEEWSCVDLETLIHCPALCESAGKVYVAGRRDPTAPWVPQHTPAGNTGIFLLERDGVTPVFAPAQRRRRGLSGPALPRGGPADHQLLLAARLSERRHRGREEAPSPHRAVGRSAAGSAPARLRALALQVGTFRHLRRRDRPGGRGRGLVILTDGRAESSWR